MKVEVLEGDNSSIKVKFEGIDRTYGNALRRIALSEVPTMAIDDVVILENTSIQYDELVAHRLGLVPLKTDLDRYILPSSCTCASPLGCNRCRVLLVLDVEAKDGNRTVYSGDLSSEDTETIPISPRIPLVKLATGQKVKLEAYAKLGRGKEHAKWQACTVSALTELPGEDGALLLKLESVGALPVREILQRAAALLREGLEGLRSLGGA